MKKQTAGRDNLGELAPKFAELNDDVLFGEVWSREDKLSARDRSMVTIAALFSAGLYPQLKSHLAMGKAHGVTKEEAVEIVTQLAFYCGWPKAWSTFPMIAEIYGDEKEPETDEKSRYQNTIMFPIGEPNTAFAQYFDGQSYLAPVSKEQILIANVTFEPGCRNHYHIHHAKSGGGQILVGVGGRGWYQEEGKEPVEILPGTVINIPANVNHWHGAAADSWFSHLAVEIPGEDASTEWREPGSGGGIQEIKMTIMYVYNALPCFFGVRPEQHTQAVTADTTVSEVKAIPAFGDFGRLLFLVDRAVDGNMTLDDLSTNGIYVWYNNIKTEKTVEIVNYLKEQAEDGRQIFYNIYTEEERKSDPSKEDTGLFFFRGEPGAEFAVMNAGGGMMYVGAMHDSFPHALEVSKRGCNAFALIYRPDYAYDDLAQAIAFIYDHADELEVNPDGYSLWGGSAGARMAATLGNKAYLQELTGRADIPQAAAVIMQYTGHSDASGNDAPTYACVGTSDGIAGWRTMEGRLQTLEEYGIPTEFHSYEGLPHGFGLGTGTVAEGWLDDAVAFWKKQMAS